MNISDALQELGSHIGLPNLELDPQGSASVVFGDEIVISMSSADEGRTLWLNAAIGGVSAEGADEDLLKMALQASLLGSATDGAHFTFDPADGQLTLERSLAMDVLDFTAFLISVENFVNQAGHWQAKFDAAQD